MGSEPLKLLQDAKLAPKGRTVTSLRGCAHQVGPQKLLYTYSPTIHEIDYGRYVDVLCDAQAAFRVATTGQYQPELGDYRYVPDLAETIAGIEAEYAVTGKPVEVSLDLETIGFDPYLLPKDGHPGAYVVSLQVTIRPGMADVLYFRNKAEYDGLISGLLGQQIRWLLTSPKISLRGANLKFDLHWLWVHGGYQCTNFKFDTNLVGSCLDENRSNALNVHAKIYTALGGYDDEFNRTIDKSRMDLVPPERLLPYAGGDTDACHQVATAMKAELLAVPSLARFYVNILHPASRAFEQVEQGGVLVDMEAYRRLEADLQAELHRLTDEAKKVLGGRVVAKHADPSKPGGMNLTKASLLTDFMFSPMGLNLKPLVFTEKNKTPSTALDHLMQFKNDERAAPFLALLSDYSSAAKTLSTYVYGFQKHIRSDGRFHPTYWFFAGNKDENEGGTDTGRLSCKDPAFQTIPKHTKWAKPLRLCFIAPPGYLVCERDYSQGELRVVACIANELNMIRAYREGMDLHALTAGEFRGFTYAQMQEMKVKDPDLYDAIRQLGKAGNFGLLYGMGVDGFLVYAEQNYGVRLPWAEGDAFRSGFFQRYPGLVDYHQEYKAFAHRHGYVASPLGRVRHLPLINSKNRMVSSMAERQAINSPVQGCLSDMMIWAIALAHQQGWFKDAPCFGSVHDSSYDYYPEDRAIEYAKRSTELMENLPFETVGWEPQLKFVADAKLGPNMAELHKVSFA